MGLCVGHAGLQLRSRRIPFSAAMEIGIRYLYEPHTANGAEFDFVDTRELGYNLELTLKPNNGGTVFRLLSYFNEGRLGSYDAALALGRDTGTAPNLLLVEGPGGTEVTALA